MSESSQKKAESVNSDGEFASNRVVVFRAQPVAGAHQAPKVTLRIGPVLPRLDETDSITEFERKSGARFDEQAALVVQALGSLPGGTLRRVTALLLRAEADRCHAIVPLTTPKEPST